MKTKLLTIVLAAGMASGCGILQRAGTAQPGESPTVVRPEEGGAGHETGHVTAVAVRGLTATPLSQTLLDIEPGEYSGITWLGGDRYAVVDDKRGGGGILHFTIPIDEYGSVGTVSVRPANGTAAGVGRDAEGIAFVPGSQTLYVSTEKDQKIRAYDLAGRETGHQLRVPADLKNITDNRGFEALTFNAVTGRFWTTTEAPLRGETLLRLQSFDDEGNPAERFLYQMDTPLQSAENASAYVFGVPALAALDDGRLIVLEREVHVPAGSIIDKLTGAFTRINLFLVDPVRDTAEVLSKTLLCTFNTGALDLANFEGMCLGPTLPDGRRCLVLIADSQKGSGGLTAEYVRVVLLR